MSSKSLFSARLALLASVFLTLFLYFIPFGGLISRPLLYLSTIVHEMGHGLVAILVGGRFLDFTMLPNGAGLARTELERGANISIALVSMGGLIGPAFVSGVLFYLCKSDKWCKVALMIFGIGLLISTFLLVKGTFALVMVGGFGVILTLAGVKGSANLCQWVAAFMAVQLSLSVFSRSDYLFTQYASGVPDKNGQLPYSDVQNIAEALFFPYWVWGLVCAAISIVCLIVGLRTVIRG